MKKVPSIKPQVPSPKKSALGRFPWNLGLGIWNLGLKHFGKLSCFGIIGGCSGTTSFGANATLSDGGAFVVKYDANGSALWAKNVKELFLTNISVDSNGNIFITGNSGASSLTFETTTLTKVGGIDIFVAKLNGAVGKK